MKSKLIFTTTICLWSIATITAQNGQERINNLKNELKSVGVDSVKVALYGQLFEILQFQNPKEAFDYAKKEKELATKINYKPGISASSLHYATYYKGIGQLDSARIYFNESKSVAKEANILIGILFANHSMADFEKQLGNYDQALKYAEENINIYANRDTIKTNFGRAFNLIGSEYELIGDVYYARGNFSIALDKTLKALRFFEEKKDTIRKADALLQIGKIEFALTNYQSAITYAKEAYSIYDSFNDNVYKGYAANNIGTYLLTTEKNNEAKSFFETALSISDTLELVDVKAQALAGLGNVYKKQKRFNTARDFFYQSIALNKELDFKQSIVIDINDLAQLEIEVSKYEKALKLTSESISLSKKIGAQDDLKTAYYLRYKALKKLRRFDAALTNYENYKAVNDSIFNITKSQQIEELRTIYDTEKKEQQLAIQKNEIALLEQKAEIDNLQKILLGGGLVLSVLLFGLGFYGIRQKMKRNRLEREKLNAELEFKKKELTTHALHLAKKNETLEGLKQQAKELTSVENGHGFKQLIRSIDFDLQDDNNWENFARYFEEVHKDFNGNVKTKYPQVTSNELRLLALLKMNLSSKEIANILNISQEGIKKARYRLRKKLDLQTEDSLQELAMSL